MLDHIRASHSIQIAAGIDVCFRLFTPKGESLWVDGWAPRYLHPTDGHTEQGMVFTTGDGTDFTVWMLVDFDPERHRSRYARVTPASRTGFVEVVCRALSASETAVDVTYDLTAQMIDGWKASIDAKMPGLLTAALA